ncbi:DNA replication/repair protein RecF [Bartonella tamiae]|uniref:DNA replication and repair protein RecF n=1 Tax=Bartonella tamiae Th239 TaxID=1094558 RepID=J0R6A0_9HYPH|nr:DNA replication/repair protein RecF [Bartonella tamiae]EJF91239.1 DNA replication and repair protein RecF [Bartonella tamiae Th239]EJF93096.1 DNA replication and repair protein RecF [Bartonella tamiae Th307]
MSVIKAQATKVTVQQLKLNNYRNYQSLQLDFSSRYVVFTGHNGAGKTNLLESLSFLSPGRGLRRAAYNDIASANNPLNGFVVFTHLLSDDFGDIDIGTTTDGIETGRKVRINGQTGSADRLSDYCRISWLVPSMDGLFMGASSDRRRFLDRMVLSVDSFHARRVMDFEKLMRARNRLLLQDHADNAWFDAVEHNMAELATAIGAARLDVVRLLTDMNAIEDGENGFPKAIVSLDGCIENALIKKSAIDVEESYRQYLHDERKSDQIAGGRTREGTHRSDLKVIYRKKNMAAALCSTGEQKALLTGLVLSHAQLTAKISGIIPILLLDEMMAHLDPARRLSLFSILDHLGGQVFMTGTDKTLFNGLDNKAEFFEIHDGALLSKEKD